MSDPEAPDADAQEQALDADPTPVAPEAPSVDAEVPEADAIEQAQPGPLEDDDAYER
jgi:hypothetical protein